MAWLERPSAIRASTSRSRALSTSSGLGAALARDQQPHDRRVECRAALRNAPHGLGEVVDVGDAVLEQVADALGALGQELHRVLGSACCESTTTPTAGVRLADGGAARTPSSVCVGGMRMSTTATSGLSELMACIRSTAFSAWATTSKPASASTRATPSRMRAESSAIATRSAPIGATVAGGAGGARPGGSADNRTRRSSVGRMRDTGRARASAVPRFAIVAS